MVSFAGTGRGSICRRVGDLRPRREDEMRHGPVRLTLALLAAGGLLAGFLVAPDGAAAAEKVVVAITSPQSGPQAAWGTELIRGAELALAEYDPKSLKFTYEILPMDDTADPEGRHHDRQQAQGRQGRDGGHRALEQRRGDSRLADLLGGHAPALRDRERSQAHAPGIHEHLPDGLHERLPGDRRRGLPGRRAQEEADRDHPRQHDPGGDDLRDLPGPREEGQGGDRPLPGGQLGGARLEPRPDHASSRRTPTRSTWSRCSRTPRWP